MSDWERLRVRVADQDAQIEALIAHLAECKAREAKLRGALALIGSTPGSCSCTTASKWQRGWWDRLTAGLDRGKL